MTRFEVINALHVQKDLLDGVLFLKPDGLAYLKCTCGKDMKLSGVRDLIEHVHTPRHTEKTGARLSHFQLCPAYTLQTHHVCCCFLSNT